MNLFTHLFLISCGASLGAMSRHGLTLLLNPLFTFLSFGTLIANYIGCLIMGIMLAMFWHSSAFSTEYRLFFVTGFLGSLTTFSAFSAEVIENLLQHKWLEGITITSLHILGCLFFTTLGVFIWRYFQ
ncbi:CrcB family protein [Histophilus somni]|uniref:Fluoride-specific ion channel FluC n=3 Tax=Histophilus somni TaxID=731 RepID=FLUC_HISS1|nr:CrcB family protein [Histophilus somni]B0UTW8.1 RecName: Full=Fluoride-specific ion channel FluC [Histophilus somni 2336]Q0I2K9.1 RecName: Full=Fluoride-specific ion channel FluC [Histophilus somni 129PT]ACA30971.1 CrcB protein [Histophilus somni 2336]ARU65005.1 chromosome condensation protein CrcB [Histophilus somni]ARU66871.1 chromosome condensation protein CrcB [Histophilus somni]ARU68742.1 chromosome condensation protein CrcB [Histophilus somni]ARU70624.1 chromosome condensation prote